MIFCDRVLFSLNKEFFLYCDKSLFWGKNRFFFFFFFFYEILLRIFWSGVVGAIDTFVAEHVSNMLSRLK